MYISLIPRKYDSTLKTGKKVNSIGTLTPPPNHLSLNIENPKYLSMV